MPKSNLLYTFGISCSLPDYYKLNLRLYLLMLVQHDLIVLVASSNQVKHLHLLVLKKYKKNRKNNNINIKINTIINF